eukprot:507393-Amphidinium_carterae.1
MEENQCYAIVKPPLHKSWVMSLHSEHGARMIKIGKHYYILSVLMDGFINKVQISGKSSDLLSHEEDSDMQHAQDVAKSFNLFDPENQPGHPAEGTHHSTSEAAQPITVPAPQEPSAAEGERERESCTTSLHSIQELV